MPGKSASCATSPRRLAAALILVMTLLAVRASAQEGMISIEIFGAALTDEGEPVAGAELQLTFTKNLVDENGLPQATDERISVLTDEQGSYSMQLMIDSEWTDFLLAISARSLDRIRYDQPRPKQLADILSNGLENGVFQFEVNWVFSSRPGWRELRQSIEGYGEESDKGRTLRIWGLPEREVEFTRNGQRGVIWFYYSQGYAVRFIGETREMEFRFQPRESPSSNR